MKNRRIIICTTSFIAYDRRMQRIGLELADHGYVLEWLGRIRKEEQIDLPFHIEDVRCFFKRGFVFYLEYNLRLFFKLLKRLNASDIVNAVDFDTLPACYWAGKFRKSTLVFDSHEYFQEVPELSNKPMKKGIWNAIGAAFIPRIKHNYTVNHSIAQIYSQRYKVDFDVIMNVPFRVEILDESPRKNIILYLGVLNKGRGIETLIDAMKDLKDYQLWLLGEGDLLDELQRLVMSNGLEKSVIFKGWVKPNEIPVYLSQAKFAANLLDDVSESYRLSLANKFFDYIHAGIPSINMSFPEYESIIDKYQVGTNIASLDSSSFVEAVREMEKEPQYHKMQKACREAAAHYNWQIESKKLIAIYDSIT